MPGNGEGEIQDHRFGSEKARSTGSSRRSSFLDTGAMFLSHDVTSLPEDVALRRKMTGKLLDGTAFKYPMFAAPIAFVMGLKENEVLPDHQKLLHDRKTYPESPLVNVWENEKRPIIFLSHQWLSYDHPDPSFAQMKIFQEAVRSIQYEKIVFPHLLVKNVFEWTTRGLFWTMRGKVRLSFSKVIITILSNPVVQEECDETLECGGEQTKPSQQNITYKIQMVDASVVTVGEENVTQSWRRCFGDFSSCVRVEDDFVYITVPTHASDQVETTSQGIDVEFSPLMKKLQSLKSGSWGAVDNLGGVLKEVFKNCLVWYGWRHDCFLHN